MKSHIDWSKAPDGCNIAFFSIQDWENGVPKNSFSWERHTENGIYEWWDNGNRGPGCWTLFMSPDNPNYHSAINNHRNRIPRPLSTIRTNEDMPEETVAPVKRMGLLRYLKFLFS